jgi:hypothetical protein
VAFELAEGRRPPQRPLHRTVSVIQEQSAEQQSNGHVKHDDDEVCDTYN